MTATTGALVVVLLAIIVVGCERRAPTLGFWFEDVTFESPALGGRLTANDLRVIENVAREELAVAFRDFDLTLTKSKNARYRVRVVPTVREHRMRREAVVAGEARGVPWIGGMGAVNFTYFASGAIVFAPAGTTRDGLIAAIGRGLGRGAVHEFAHQLISHSDLHHGRDRGSYEYHAASREQQYYGPMHWDVAGPILKRKYPLSQISGLR